MKSKISKILPALLGTLLYLLLLLPFFLIWIPHRILLAPEQIYLFDIGVFRYLGLVPIALGVLIYVLCSRSFVFIGKGTPIPFTPTKELIVTGFYRFVRNPLYYADRLDQTPKYDWYLVKSATGKSDSTKSNVEGN
jgi:protein-S-isoprenylcysteine O-methyltransferase Ste14